MLTVLSWAQVFRPLDGIFELNYTAVVSQRIFLSSTSQAPSPPLIHRFVHFTHFIISTMSMVTALVARDLTLGDEIVTACASCLPSGEMALCSVLTPSGRRTWSNCAWDWVRCTQKMCYGSLIWNSLHFLIWLQNEGHNMSYHCSHSLAWWTH